MRNLQIFIVIMALVGCAKHTSINHMYPEFSGKQVVTTQDLFLLEVTMDNQINHPDFTMMFSKPQYVPTGELLKISKGSIIHIENFYEHIRFTEAGTEMQGWVKLGKRKIEFFKTLNHSYSGINKQSDLPWVLLN